MGTDRQYDSAELREERIVNISKEEGGEEGLFFITSDNETSIKAKKVVLAVGYHDVYNGLCNGYVTR